MNLDCNTILEVSTWLQSLDWQLIVTAILGYLGLRTWKTVHIGKRRLEVAEDTLVLSYKFEDAINDIRSVAEFTNAGQTSEERKLEKLKNYDSLFKEFYSSRTRYKAFFGVRNAEDFRKLNQIINKLYFALSIKDYQKELDVLYNVNDKDELSLMLKKSISEIEKRIRSLLFTRVERRITKRNELK